MTVTILRQKAAAIFTEEELQELRLFFEEHDFIGRDNLSLQKLRCFIEYYFEAY